MKLIKNASKTQFVIDGHVPCVSYPLMTGSKTQFVIDGHLGNQDKCLSKHGGI